MFGPALSLAAIEATRCCAVPQTTEMPGLVSDSFERNTPVLMIRLARVGARKQPHYRIVVIEKDRARNGRSVEVVGTYNPRTEPASVTLKHDRIQYWTSKGAQLSEIVAKLLKKASAPVEVADPALAAS